jgi:fucose permease
VTLIAKLRLKTISLIYFASFYYGYLVFVFPSANLAQRCPWGPTVYLGGSLVAWGVVLACTSINASFPVFFVLRFILGM